MRAWLWVLGGIAVVATIAAVVFGVLVFTNDSDTEATPGGAGACDNKLYGQVHSITRKGDGYELRFDPAMFTSGATANTAAAEDGAVAPGEPVPNDNYVVDESHRLYTYVLPADAKVSVLTRQAESLASTPITVAQLEQLLRGETPVELFEGLDTGFWMRYHVDAVCSLEQQYKP